MKYYTTNNSALFLLALGNINVFASAQQAANCGNIASLCGAGKCVKDFGLSSVICVDEACVFNETSIAYQVAVALGKDLDDVF
jgi:hypothetical protein